MVRRIARLGEMRGRVAKLPTGKEVRARKHQASRAEREPLPKGYYGASIRWERAAGAMRASPCCLRTTNGEPSPMQRAEGGHMLTMSIRVCHVCQQQTSSHAGAR